MKKLTVLAAVLMTGMINMAHARVEDCATKRAALEKEISIAQHYGNMAKVNSLKHALAEVKAHCTDATVLAKAQKEVTKLEKKLAEKQSDIREVQADLREAQARGKKDKIAKYQRKLSEKKADLQEIQQKLNQARADLAALQK
ncbi:DUF1090 domain-containing protein [Mixta calida]|uniref:DUF1090 domain-containing protein n=1 Tax=Mixta calida TaxID=665913 RepID=UPI000EDDA8DA|nr:DUF1090 domain-containing protein [Mixta calida]HCW47954.1 DUF1090 domain-containing protein [Erwiniaceae bacterium]